MFCFIGHGRAMPGTIGPMCNRVLAMHVCIHIGSSEVSVSMTENTCPICFESVPWQGGWRWPCLHAVHQGCVSMSRSSRLSLSGPCYVCRTPSHPDAAEMFLETFPHEASFAVRNRPFAASPPPSPVQAGLADTIPIVPLCCARVLGPIDGEFVSTPGDRRMRYVGVNGGLSWVCLQCDREVHNPPLPPELTSWMASGGIGAPTHRCPDHGQMCYVMDGWMRYFSCCTFEHGDVPLPIMHLTAMTVTADIPDDQTLLDIPDDDQDMPDHPYANSDLPDDDQDVMIVGEGEMSPEDVLREMQRLAETYETAEEEIALEALLQSYEP